MNKTKNMNILYLGSDLSKSIFDWLVKIGENAIYTDKKINIDIVKNINPDFIISYDYDFVISEDILNFMNNKIINLYISFFPYNKGVKNNILGFLKDIPTGVVIHYVKDIVHKEDILFQRKAVVDTDKDTLKKIHENLHNLIQKLFKEKWEIIKREKIDLIKNSQNIKELRDQFFDISSREKTGISQLNNLNKNFKIGNVLMKNFINLNEEEKEIVRNWRNNDAIRVWYYSDHIISFEEHNNFMINLKSDNRNAYWLVESEGEYKGVVYLSRLDFKNRNGYFGIYSNPDLKGVGNMLEGCLLKVAFDVACLHTLKLEVIKGNERALKLYERFGFKKEGELKDFVYKNGNYNNVFIMGILNKNGN